MAAFCELDGSPVFKATISFPRIGCWHADLLVAGSTVPQGVVPLTFGTGAISWMGSVYRGGAPYETGLLRFVGGSGGIGGGIQIPAKAYQSVPLRIVLQDILSAAGERLSGSADPSVLSIVLKSWSRCAGPAGLAIAELMAAVGASWRMNPDGSVWVGFEKWPVDNEAFSVLTSLPNLGRDVVYADTPDFQPGTVLNGRKISYVQHEFSEQTLRSVLLYEDQVPAALDRVKQPFAAIARLFARNPYLKRYGGVVVSQSADRKTVDFKPDDPTIAAPQAIPLFWGEPGMDVAISCPARAHVAFENGDPSKPYIADWAAGTTFTNLAIAGGTSGAARNGDYVDPVAAWLTWFGAVGGVVGTPPPTPPHFGSISSGSAKVQVG